MLYEEIQIPKYSFCYTSTCIIFQYTSSWIYKIFKVKLRGCEPAQHIQNILISLPTMQLHTISLRTGPIYHQITVLLEQKEIEIDNFFCQ